MRTEEPQRLGVFVRIIGAHGRAEDAHIEIFPEVVRAKHIASGSTRTRTGWRGNERAVGRRELNLHDHPNEFGLAAMVELSLLCAVSGAMLAGGLNSQRKRCEERDRSDVRPGARHGKNLGVFGKKAGRAFVSALAEEIGFADGLLRKRRVESEGRRSKKSRGQNSKDRPEPGGHIVASMRCSSISTIAGLLYKSQPKRWRIAKLHTQPREVVDSDF